MGAHARAHALRIASTNAISSCASSKFLNYHYKLTAALTPTDCLFSALPDRPVRRSISALGWPKVYSPGETLIYYWFVHNNYANIMNPRNGEFTVPHTGIYFVSFYGEVGPTSPTKKNVFASIVVGIDEVAYVYAAYDDHYESGSMQVVRHIGKGTPVFVRNGKRFSVKWEGFGISVVFITE